jgi:predicted peptidase
MKTSHFLIIAVFGLNLIYLNTLMAQSTAQGGQQSVHSFESRLEKKVGVEYLLYLPQRYEEAESTQWPLMLFLHGAGERGDQIDLVTKHGPPKLVKEDPDFPFILVSPQCPAGEIWDNDVLLALLDEVSRDYRVDENRVYLTGLSMGGYGTWSLGTKHPERFAAIIPICGGGNTIDVKLAGRNKREALQSLGVWAFHGGKDPLVDPQESKRMIEAFKSSGNEQAKLTIFPDAGHDSWTQAYSNPDLYDWILKHQR